MADDSYKKRVERAYLAAQEVLGSLAVASEQAVLDVEQGVQEVEVKCYDSDSLSSPPASSDESDGDLDPLLDFSRDDDLTHRRGTEGPAVIRSEGPAMVRSAIHAQRALEGMQNITRGVQQRKQNEEERSGLVSTQAMFTPVFPKSGEARWQPAAMHPQDRQGAKPQQEATRPTPVAQTELPVERQLSGMVLHGQDHTKPRGIIPERPPPIPSYNPERPDSFLLSNQPDYRIPEQKKTPRTYKPAEREEVARLQPQEKPEASGLNVLMRTKRKAPSPPTQEGYVADPKGKQRSFSPPSLQPTDEITDIHVERACMGLPENVHKWRGEEVGVWLKQLSVTLYGLYFSCFSKHDVTGRTLLRLNESRLRAMDIRTPKHCRLLALHIARLKIQQEALELAELSEDGKITYL